MVFHVMNRGARRGRLFDTADEYDAFVRVLCEARHRCPIRLLTFCVMPNHFHLLVWPEADPQLPCFMHRLTMTHARRWRIATETCGEGVLYQGRYRAIPVQTEEYFLTVARYVERNPLRAGLVSRAEDWRWSSLWHRRRVRTDPPLAPWPVPAPADWVDHVNRPQARDEVRFIRRSIQKGCALGNADWQEETAKRLNIPRFYAAPGRPRRNRR